MHSNLEPVQLRVDRATILKYATLTDDHNPIHVDPAFAATTAMGGVIAHGTLSLNLIWRALQATLDARELAGIVLDIRFTSPVRENDLVTAGGRLRPDGRSYDVWVRNQAGTPAIEGVALLPAVSAGRGARPRQA